MLIQILLPLFIIASTAIASITQDLNSALLKAAEAGDTARVEALLAQGADLNAKNNVGDTPLSIASFRGHLEIVKILIAKGSDLNQDCPLCEALREGRVFGKKRSQPESNQRYEQDPAAHHRHERPAPIGQSLARQRR